jgi:hypothetical protein
MSLQDQLNTLKTNFESKAPKEALDIMHRATGDLRKSGILDRILNLGDKIPDFSLKNADGTMCHSKDILSESSMILTFYRGKW